MKQSNNELSDIDIFIEKTFGHELLQEIESVKQTEENDKKFYKWLSEQKIKSKKVEIKTNNCIFCKKIILLNNDKMHYIKYNSCEKCYITNIEGKTNDKR